MLVIIVILDDVQSAVNVGSIFRKKDAAGIEETYTVGLPPYPNRMDVPI